MTCPARETTRVGRCGPERLSGTRTTRRIRVSGSIQPWGRRRRGTSRSETSPGRARVGMERASEGTRYDKVRLARKFFFNDEAGCLRVVRVSLSFSRSRHRLRVLSRHAHGPLRDAQEAPVHVLELDDLLPEAPHVRRVGRGGCRCSRFCFCSRCCCAPFDGFGIRRRSALPRVTTGLWRRRGGRTGRSRLSRLGGRRGDL